MRCFLVTLGQKLCTKSVCGSRLEFDINTIGDGSSVGTVNSCFSHHSPWIDKFLVHVPSYLDDKSDNEIVEKNILCTNKACVHVHV